MKKSRTTNPELLRQITFLKKKSAENKAEIWRKIAETLTKPRRRSVSINLSRLNRYTRKSETVVVPGKVLGTGTISHPVNVAAFAFSSAARQKILASRGKCLSFPDIVKKDPKGSKVKIIG